MTAPILHDYADWNRAVAQSDVVYINDGGHITSIDVVYSIGQVANTRALYVFAIATANPVRVTVKWFADAAFTMTIQTYDIDLRNGDDCTQIVPVLGPYAQVIVHPGPSVPITYSLLVISAPERGVPDGVLPVSQEISQWNQAIGAGATVVIESSLVLAGPAVWEAWCSAASWTSRLIVVDINGAETILSAGSNLQGGSPVRSVYLPSMHVKIAIANADAAPKVYNAFLTRSRV